MNAKELCSRLAIQDLTNRYALFVDTKQLDPLIDLFWGDAVFDGVGSARGRFAVKRLFENIFRRPCRPSLSSCTLQATS